MRVGVPYMGLMGATSPIHTGANWSSSMSTFMATTVRASAQANRPDGQGWSERYCSRVENDNGPRRGDKPGMAGDEWLGRILFIHRRGHEHAALSWPAHGGDEAARGTSRAAVQARRDANCRGPAIRPLGESLPK